MTKLILVGGFLGAGKTTLMLAAGPPPDPRSSVGERSAAPPEE